MTTQRYDLAECNECKLEFRKDEPSYALTAAFWVALAVMLFACIAGAQASSQPVAPAQNWEQQLLELAGVALMAGLTFAVGAARAWFAAHAKSSLAQYGAGVFARLSSAALTAVQSTQQVVNRDLASGFTKANAATLKSDALALVKSQLGPAGLAELASIVGLDQVAEVLSTHVEAAVLQVNQAAAAPAK
jgi:hypothetical protein